MAASFKKIGLDAAGKRLGRLASDIADMLNGKHSPAYMPNRVPDITVEVANASQMRIDERRGGKVYDRYTGFFHGRKEITLTQLAEKKGYREVLRRAVYGMLPGNRLRSVKMNRLHIHE